MYVNCVCRYHNLRTLLNICEENNSFILPSTSIRNLIPILIGNRLTVKLEILGIKEFFTGLFVQIKIVSRRYLIMSKVSS